MAARWRRQQPALQPLSDHSQGQEPPTAVSGRAKISGFDVDEGS
jgi:hypothetical protein